MSHEEQEILSFWLGEDASLPSPEVSKQWFLVTEETTAKIRKKFKKLVLNAIEGKNELWADSPRGCLALIILLDQFPRRIFHNTPNAYAQDLKALEFCLKGIEREHDKYLTLLQRVFFYFPLMHSESYPIQQRSVILYESLNLLSLPETRELFELFAQYAFQHYEIIKNFGRFPDRNVILGRQSTPEELEFLKISDFSS